MRILDWDLLSIILTLSFSIIVIYDILKRYRTKNDLIRRWDAVVDSKKEKRRKANDDGNYYYPLNANLSELRDISSRIGLSGYLSAPLLEISKYYDELITKGKLARTSKGRFVDTLIALNLTGGHYYRFIYDDHGDFLKEEISTWEDLMNQGYLEGYESILLEGLRESLITLAMHMAWYQARIEFLNSKLMQKHINIFLFHTWRSLIHVELVYLMNKLSTHGIFNGIDKLNPDALFERFYDDIRLYEPRLFLNSFRKAYSAQLVEESMNLISADVPLSYYHEPMHPVPYNLVIDEVELPWKTPLPSLESGKIDSSHDSTCCFH